MSTPTAFKRLARNAGELARLLPAELVEGSRWVAWDGKKVPINPRTGGNADVSDPATWATLEQAVVFHQKATDTSRGVGRVFAIEDRITGIDLDEACEPDRSLKPGAGGALKPWARKILDRFAGAYVERSPSGSGLHLWVRGTVSENRNCRNYPGKGEAVEVYSTGKYFTITGNVLGGAPPRQLPEAQSALNVFVAGLPAKSVATVKAATNDQVTAKPGPGLSDEDVIALVDKRAHRDAKLRRLLTGNTSDYNGDDSSADLALLSRLAYYTGPDRNQLDRLFRRTNLCRDKWERKDYRERTIARALEGRTDFYTPPPPISPEPQVEVVAPRPEKVEPMPLLEAVATFERWLHLEDVTPLLAVLATAAANLHLTGDPVWLLDVGASGAGKTERLRALCGQPQIFMESTLTEASLMSGSAKRDRNKDSTGGVLRRVGERGVIIFKDFTSVLAQNNEARGPALAALRECYDGTYTRSVGVDGGRTLTWTGHLGVIAGCTPTYDRYHSITASLGERFLIVRTGAAERRKLALSALGHKNHEVEMRSELAAAVAALFSGLDRKPPEMSSSERALIVWLADLVSRARSPVERDRGSREVELIGDAEAPTRLAGALARLRDGVLALGARRDVAMLVVARAAMDSIPGLRRRALETLRQGECDTSAVAVALKHPTGTVRRTLEDLAGHGLVKRTPQGSGKADKWALDKEVANDLGGLPAIPSLAGRGIKEGVSAWFREVRSPLMPDLRVSPGGKGGVALPEKSGGVVEASEDGAKEDKAPPDPGFDDKTGKPLPDSATVDDKAHSNAPVGALEPVADLSHGPVDRFLP